MPYATVQILQNNEIIATLETDISGYTQEIAIETPPVNNSLTPNGEVPYTFVTIIASKEGFFTGKYIDAQIFPNIITLQQINLIPFPNEVGGYTDIPIRVYKGEAQKL